MELQFNKTAYPCLHRLLGQYQTQEQTQEVRLMEDMPDIGKILGCWGKVLVRGKQWQSGGITVSGGVMAWVLYASEDAQELKCLDTWIPFQMKWDIPETKHDGAICVMPQLVGMDARSISARKLMIRANVSLYVQATEPTELEVYFGQPQEEDIQLLQQTYPLDIPQEAGEKQFSMEETIEISQNQPAVEKIVYYYAQPEISEQKVLGSKLVFRGDCLLHAMYLGEDQKLHNMDQVIAFSQYADLDRDYSVNATAWIAPVMTGLEMDLDGEGKLQVKCAAVAQYSIFDRVLVETVEDAYCLKRKLTFDMQTVQVPIRLDERKQKLSCREAVNAVGRRVIDVSACWGNANAHQIGDSLHAEFPVQFQLLYMDDTDTLQCAHGSCVLPWDIESARGNDVHFNVHSCQMDTEVRADTVAFLGEMEIEMSAYAQQEIPMITSLELGDTVQMDENRPSLVLRKAGKERLWDLAKACGSTVSAIQQANQLAQDPLEDQMLLVPVY